MVQYQYSIFLQTWHINNEVMVPAAISKNCLSAIHLEYIPPTAGKHLMSPNPKTKQMNPPPPPTHTHTQIETLRKSIANDPRIVFASICKQLNRRKFSQRPHRQKHMTCQTTNGPLEERGPKGATYPNQSSNVPPISIREPC